MNNNNNNDDATCHTPERGGSVDSAGGTPIHFETASVNSPEHSKSAPKCTNKSHNHDKYIGMCAFVAFLFQHSWICQALHDIQSHTGTFIIRFILFVSFSSYPFSFYLHPVLSQGWVVFLPESGLSATCAMRPMTRRMTHWWLPATAVVTPGT